MILNYNQSWKCALEEGNSAVTSLMCKVETVCGCGRRFSKQRRSICIRLKSSLGLKKLPAWDPGKGKLPGFSARKKRHKTRAENLLDNIVEFYSNICSSPLRAPDSLHLTDVATLSSRSPQPGAKSWPWGTKREQLLS